MIEIKKNSNNQRLCCGKIHKSPEEKVDDLKKALQELGYSVEETEDGIRVCNSKK
jgi:hypothetical protein